MDSLKMTRVAFLGDVDDVSKSGAQRLAAMREIGVHIVGVVDFALLPAVSRFEPRLAALIDRPALRGTLHAFNAGLLARCETFERPDICWIEWPQLLLPETLQLLRRRWPVARFVCFQDDNPFGKRREAAIWSLFRQCIPEFDLHLLKRDEDLINFRRAGARRVEKFLGGYSRALLATAPPSAGQDLDVVFVGTAMDERSEWLLRLHEGHGIAVHAYGGKWRKSRFGRRHPQLVHPHANGAAYVETITRSRICLGFVSHSNRDGFTMRSFEVPALGTFLLAERTSEHAALYREGIEAEFFGSLEECSEKIRTYLADDARRSAVAHAGRERCLAQYSLAASVEQAIRQALAEGKK